MFDDAFGETAPEAGGGMFGDLIAGLGEDTSDATPVDFDPAAEAAVMNDAVDAVSNAFDTAPEPGGGGFFGDLLADAGITSTDPAPEPSDGGGGFFGDVVAAFGDTTADATPEPNGGGSIWDNAFGATDATFTDAPPDPDAQAGVLDEAVDAVSSLELDL